MQFSLQSAVSYLCGNGMIEMLDLLEDVPGIDWDHADTEGNTPLHFAAQAGHVEVVSFLLNRYARCFIRKTVSIVETLLVELCTRVAMICLSSPGIQ